MDTWTIRYTETSGETTELAPMSKTDAKTLLDGVRRYIDPDAVLVDLVAEIAARMPVGSRIRHTVRGWTGTVVLSSASAAPFPRLPAVSTSGKVAYVPTGRYTAVCVQFDHRKSPEWFDAEFIAPAPTSEETPMAKLTGRTITVEEIGQVPELARAWRVDEYDLRIIERQDGVFVCAHGNGPTFNPMWDNARFLAERLEATYVGPGRQESRPAQEVRVGWYVLAGPPRNPGWCRVEQVTELVDLTKRETGPRPRLRIVVEGRAPITVRPAAPVECRAFVGA